MKKVTLKTLTPVHIGSGNELQRDIEFLYKQGELAVIDEQKVLNIIGEENIHQWVSIIEKRENLLNYLEKRKPELKIPETAKRTMKVFCRDLSRAKTLKEQLHDGMGYPYIPGSSIKGAIRTAFLNDYIKTNSRKFIENELRTGKKRTFSDKMVVKEAFGPNPNKDIMRFLKVGDASFRKESVIAVNMLSMNYSFKRIRLEERLSKLTEAIGAEENTTLNLKIDHNLLNQNIKNENFPNKIPNWFLSYESLAGSVNNFTKKTIISEIDFWEEDKDVEIIRIYRQKIMEILKISDKCAKNEFVLRLGHGSGWIFITGAWIKDDNLIEERLYDKIIDETRPNNKRYKDYFFPKTRRMDEDGDLLGFVKLTIQ